MSSTKRSTLPPRDNEKIEQPPSPMLDPAIFRVMADSAPIIILLLDAQGNIQHINPYFEHLTGYRLDEIKGKNWFTTFLPDRDQERIRALFQSALYDLPIRNRRDLKGFNQETAHH